MPLKKRKVATHANATLVHSIPANSARVATSTGPRATAWTPAPTRTAALLITRLARAALAPNPFRWTLGARGGQGRHDPRQSARPPPAAGLLARARVLLLDALLEFGEPLLHRPLDLGPRRARLFRPDARPVRTNGFGRRVRVGRFGFDRDLRREFRHLPKSYRGPVPEPARARPSRGESGAGNDRARGLRPDPTRRSARGCPQRGRCRRQARSRGRSRQSGSAARRLQLPAPSSGAMTRRRRGAATPRGRAEGRKRIRQRSRTRRARRWPRARPSDGSRGQGIRRPCRPSLRPASGRAAMGPGRP